MKISKKIFLVILVFIFFVISIIILFRINIQKIETTKKVYAVGEKISYTWSDFKLYRCTFDDTVEFYKFNNGLWEYMPPTPMLGGGDFCLDGKQQIFIGSPLCCQKCRIFDKPYQKKSVENKIYFFEKIEDGTCENSGDEILPSYKSIPASAGIYKIQLGKVETTFEIK